ncbi:unnamed protein product [Vitrella brassicaformis CCMP3155]|uniref:Potassium channel tetramerisation-type BTB domain-containing protein n=1 Tax=Vitrella brassicaformis (strain CCMP3155) TaxID=1169540 RepID=A0A0G4FRC9_VITBC|nr:unnamed protein product [Vitrella brassicaformis CCMP3155]|eukprot:CEM16788.1 unnamed protein product [Vitrella brassicaformis CCMP3155]
MSAAAAAAGGSKKRKNQNGRAADDELPAPSRLHGVTIGRQEGDSAIRQASTSLDELAAATETARSRADDEIERLAEEIKQLFTANGGTVEPHKTSGQLQLNVGGTVFFISVQRLLHPKMKMTYLSTLLLHFTDQLPKDENNLPFLEMHPAYFRWLRDQLALLESPHLDEIAIHSPEADDPSYAEYHPLFMQHVVEEEEGEKGGDEADVDMADKEGSSGVEGGQKGDSSEEGQGEGGRANEPSAEDAFEKIEEYMNSYRRALAELQKQKEGMEAFLAAMRSFVKGDSSDEDTEVMTLTVENEQVSILRRSLAYFGPNHALVKRYNPDEWPDQEARQTSLRFQQLIVDFARRLSVMLAGRFVHSPVVAPHEKATLASSWECTASTRCRLSVGRRGRPL